MRPSGRRRQPVEDVDDRRVRLARVVGPGSEQPHRRRGHQPALEHQRPAPRPPPPAARPMRPVGPVALGSWTRQPSRWLTTNSRRPPATPAATTAASRSTTSSRRSTPTTAPITARTKAARPAGAALSAHASESGGHLSEGDQHGRQTIGPGRLLIYRTRRLPSRLRSVRDFRRRRPVVTPLFLKIGVMPPWVSE